MATHESPRDDVDLGAEVTRETRARQAAGIVVSVRLCAQEAEQLHVLAHACGKTLSEVAREALRASLSNAARHVVPAGVTATATNETPLWVCGPLGATTTAPMVEQHGTTVVVPQSCG